MKDHNCEHNDIQSDGKVRCCICGELKYKEPANLWRKNNVSS